jgi:hypothetical protein
MEKILLGCALVITVMSVGNVASAETLNIYPTNDAMALLYDDEAISDWTLARAYQGDLVQPIAETTDRMAVRSDNGVGTYRIYRASDIFDLSSIPGTATISSAKLMLYKTPDNNQGDVTVVVTSHERVLLSEMQDQDWSIQNFGAEFSRAKLLDNQHTEFVFVSAGLDYLNSKKGEIAVLGLLTHFDFDNIVPFGYYIQAAGWYTIENPGTEFDPYLEITYTVPEVDDGIDREEFLALVMAATEDEKSVTQKFFVATANRLFDLIDAGNDRLARIHLQVFATLLRAKGIENTELTSALQELKEQL